MKKHLLTLITSTACLIAGTAQAQQCCCDDSFYVGALAGVNFIQDIKSHGVKASLDTGYIVGANVGYRICDNIRVEAEFAYRNNNKTHRENVDYAFDSKIENISNSKVKADIKTYSLMANAYYDFDLCSCFTPYVGVGIGYAWNDFTVTAKSIDFSDRVKLESSSNRFAWQLMAGVDYELCSCPDIKVGLEYRYFNPHKKLDEHAVLVTFKYGLCSL